MKSLEDQLKNIKSIFNDIKNAISKKGVSISDCDELELYADKINEISVESINVLAYKASETTPEKPIGGSWDGKQIIYPNGWSDGSELSGEIYMSQAIFSKDSTIKDWTNPIKITGPAGIPGKDGVQGPKGDPGDIRILERYVPIYKTSEWNPGMPKGGSWDVSTDEITAPDGWSLSSELSYPIWNSWGKFLAENPNAPTWSSPIRISGVDGKSGEDGESEEFIYKQTKTSLQVPSTPESKNESGYVPTGWTDHPGGITEDNTCEWICTRKKVSGNWSDWSSPVIWAKWGVNGQDGDGVEYVYIAKSSAETPNNPTPKDYETNNEYQQDDYIPIGWTDEPVGVSSSSLYSWVCSRKGAAGRWGSFSNPALWAKYGENGESGLSVREMYTATSSSTEVPIVVKDDENPGSIWTLLIPTSSDTVIWAINAYFKYDGTLATEEEFPGLVYGWSDPYIKNGKSGKDGIPANYVTTVFCESISQPFAPKENVSPDNPGTSLNVSGDTVIWKVLPDSTSQSWWRCSGKVNGTTELVEKWGSVTKDTGRDGVAIDGKREEFRYAVSDNLLDTPPIDTAARTPDGWYLTSESEYNDLLEQVREGKYLFWTKATIDENDELYTNWCAPAPINGPKGDIGPTGPQGSVGPQGVSGVPGVSFEIQYAIGNASNYIDTWYSSVSDCKVTEENPYIWVKQGRKVYSDSETFSISWEDPFRLQGINGLNGKAGEKGQIIYPAGIYSKEKEYRTDSYKAPYVYDTLTGKFYVLNDSIWAPDQETPIAQSSSWVAFDTMDAIFAKIGVIPNALIGSAVYNGDYMFSQQGDGDYSDFSVSDAEAWENTGDTSSLVSFKPNILINFRTGSAYFGKGAFSFNADGKSEFRINYPNSSQTAMLLSSDNPGIVQYWPNGQVQKKEVWDYDSSGDPVSIITNYYNDSGDLVATVDAMGQYSQVSGGWSSYSVKFAKNNLPIIDDWFSIIKDPTIPCVFYPSTLPEKDLYYYSRSGASGEYDGLKYDVIKQVTDPAPTSLENVFSGVSYDSRDLVDIKIKCATLENTLNHSVVFRNAVKVYKNGSKWISSLATAENVEILSYDHISQGDFDPYIYADMLKQPVVQLIKVKCKFDRWVDGKVDNKTIGQPEQIIYAVKVYLSKNIYDSSNISEIENNCEYYFMISENDVPSEILNYTESAELSNVGWFVNFKYE